LVHVSGDLIGKIEKGERRPHTDLVARCDDVLACGGALVAVWASDTTDPDVRAMPSVAERDHVMAYLPGLRRALDSHDLPDDGPTPSLDDMRSGIDRLIHMRLASHYVRLSSDLSDTLPGYLRAYHCSQGQDQAEVAGLLTQALRAADAIADKFGLFDLSARIIEIMMRFAAESGDPVTIAVVAYVRGEIFFANHNWSAGTRVLERASTALTRLDREDEAAAYGALHMRAAVLASRAGLDDRAHEYISEAAATAARVPEGIYRGTAFGPASVRIHHVSLAMDGGDPDQALRVAGTWVPPLSVPAERRSHFFVELADAQARCGKYSSAVTTLQIARRIAPQHVRYHPQVRATLLSLTDNVPVATHDLRELSRWAGATRLKT
jgi:hypothetical protein